LALDSILSTREASTVSIDMAAVDSEMEWKSQFIVRNSVALLFTNKIFAILETTWRPLEARFCNADSELH